MVTIQTLFFDGSTILMPGDSPPQAQLDGRKPPSCDVPWRKCMRSTLPAFVRTTVWILTTCFSLGPNYFSNILELHLPYNMCEYWSRVFMFGAVLPGCSFMHKAKGMDETVARRKMCASGRCHSSAENGWHVLAEY